MVEVERTKEGIKCGIQIIGESKVQEAESKFDQITEKVEKHLVGHLQTSKAKKAVELLDLIQSLDSQHLAQKLSKRAGQMGRVMDVLVEINTSGEKTKFGIGPDEVFSFIKSISDLEGIKIKGLITIGLFSQNAEDTRELAPLSSTLRFQSEKKTPPKKGRIRSVFHTTRAENSS